jgi:glycosyltransferase domain-containing protein
LLKYYRSYEFPFRIIILDSSSNKLELDELIEILKDTRICYQKFESNIFFTQKIAAGIGFVQTPYVALCADDDFIVPTAVEKCIRFLELNPDYSSAHGLYITHRNKNFSLNEQLKASLDWSPQYINGQSIEDSRPFDRMKRYLSGNAGIFPFYSVHRRENFLLIWSEAAQYVSDWGLSELFPCALSLIYGKMKVLPIFYASREPNNYVWFDNNQRRAMYSAEKCERAIQGLAVHLQRVSAESLETSLEHARKNLEMCVANTFSVRQSFLKKMIQSKFYTIVLKYFFLRNYINKIKKVKYSHIITSPNSPYYSDFLKLSDAVCSSGSHLEELNNARKSYMID